MSEQKHSPLPWTAVPWHKHGLISLCDKDDFVVAELSGPNTAVNAPFVVQAVNAHAALVEACQAAETWFGGSVLSAQEQYIFGLIRTALAQAGEA